MSAPPPHDVPDRRDWTRQAACRDKPARWFTDAADQTDVTRALAVCQTCSARAPCLAAALAHTPDTDVGIWGGTTEHTRHRIRTGSLAIDELPQPQPGSDVHAEPLEEATRPELHAARQTRSTHGIPRLPQPELTVGRNNRGDYVSADGRVVIFRVHGRPPWMLAIDQRPLRRTETLRQARQVAWTALHPETPPGRDRPVAPARRP